MRVSTDVSGVARGIQLQRRRREVFRHLREVETVKRFADGTAVFKAIVFVDERRRRAKRCVGSAAVLHVCIGAGEDRLFRIKRNGGLDNCGGAVGCVVAGDAVGVQYPRLGGSVEAGRLRKTRCDRLPGAVALLAFDRVFALARRKRRPREAEGGRRAAFFERCRDTCAERGVGVGKISTAGEPLSPL